MVRAVERYTHSAKIEASILNDIKNKGGCSQNIVDLQEIFTHESNEGRIQNTCLVFEPLGKSLFDFIKANKYQGFDLSQVKDIAM